ncbi:MAG: serine/threonine protein kinase [Planctomycetes bacterium]|nr:serine/threonine protein kinase [Planctomycetota bacterium]
MGIVHQAWDPRLRRIVALKTLLMSAGSTSEDVERFQREARAAARLRHPNVVQVHEVGDVAGRPYFTMDFLLGESFALALESMPRRRVLEVLREAALALHAAHEVGLVHRDVKPANILLDAGGRAYVTDFGIAKAVQDEAKTAITRTGAVIGTPEYMSPEQASGCQQEVGRQADVWSLGVILYEHLAGVRPFRGQSVIGVLMSILTADPPPPSAVAFCVRSDAEASAPAPRPPVPRDLEAICLKALSKDRARRYTTALQFAEELQRYLNGEPVVARVPSRAAAAARWTRRNRLPVVLAAVVLGLLLGGTLLFRAYRTKQAEGERIKEEAQLQQEREGEARRKRERVD